MDSGNEKIVLKDLKETIQPGVLEIEKLARTRPYGRYVPGAVHADFARLKENQAPQGFSVPFSGALTLIIYWLVPG